MPKRISKKWDLALSCFPKLLEKEPSVFQFGLCSCSQSVEVGLGESCVQFVMQYVIGNKHVSNLFEGLIVSLIRHPDKQASVKD